LRPTEQLMKFLTFDIESCTGNPFDGSLCSFGYILTEDGKVLDRADLLVNPLPPRFMLGFKNKPPRIKLAYDVKAFRMSPRFNARYCEIKALFEQADMVLGFAVANDLRYINNACDMFSLKRFSFVFIDVQLLAGLMIPELKNAGLKAVADHFNIEFLEHRSDEDARVTYEIFDRLLSSSGKDIEEIVAEYGIVPGKNTADGHINCYSLIDVKERAASTTRSSRKILINYYTTHAPEVVKRQGDLYKGVSFAFAEGLYLNDIATARSAIVTAASQGAEFESSILKCGAYVLAEGDKSGVKVKRLNPHCKIITVDELFAACGGRVDYPFDDEMIMEEHYAVLSTDRQEKIC